MPYTPIVATLGYIMSPDRTQVLMVHRNARPDDIHFGKYNGLGGKIGWLAPRIYDFSASFYARLVRSWKTHPLTIML